MDSVSKRITKTNNSRESQILFKEGQISELISWVDLLSNCLEIIGVNVFESESNTTEACLSNQRGENFVKDVITVVLVHWYFAAIFHEVASAIMDNLLRSTFNIDSVGVINFGVLNYSQLSSVFGSEWNLEDHEFGAASNVVVNWEFSILKESQ